MEPFILVPVKTLALGMIALDWSKKSRMEGQSLWFKVLKILQRSCVKKIGNVVRYIAQIVTTFLLVSYTLIIYTQTGILNQSGHNCFVLYAFVEILQEAPEGWNLVLVDTPGFGEANIRHVTAHLFKDNRFVVAVNKYDQRFLQGSLQRHNRTLGDKRQLGSAADIARNLRHKTRSFISESVKCEPLRDVEIVLVSAIWATTSLWLRADPHEDDVQCAKDILKSYPDPLPQGQGEVSPLDLASNLDSINGLPSLESKLKAMITNCIRIWRTSLAKAYTGYLEKARLALLDHHQRRTEERTRVGTTLALHANLNAKMDLLNGLAYVEGDQTPEIEFKLEEAYMRQDVETAKRFLHARIEDMTGNLIQVMKERIANTGKLFIQRDFEEGGFGAKVNHYSR
jgi:hypothetical protein